MEAGSSVQLLKQHTLVDTRSPDEAREAIGRIFCPHFLMPKDRCAQGFHAVHRSARQRGYSMNFVSYGAEVEIDPGELKGFFLLQIPLAGSASVRCGTETALVSPGRVASLLSPTLPTRMRWSDGCDKLIVLVEREAMQRQCEELAGRPIDAVEFSTAVDTTSAAGRLLMGHVRLMLEAVELQPAAPGDYLRRLGESLASLLLTSLAHSQRATLETPVPPAGSAAVQRAEEFVRANIERAFAVADIAAAAGTSLRSLQEGVRRERKTTLTQMIETIRMERFRVALADAGNRASVTEIAGMVGLGHLGRAAAAYRQRYGETPSETLRKKR
jgi:AraC-like DNA-binding protein